MTAAEWQSTHIFYSASPRPLLLDCVSPLITELDSDGLLSGYFFINYWLEGPHVRLRLQPSSHAVAAQVGERTTAAITDFLRKRPALYEVPPGFLEGYYEKLLDLEYSPEQRQRLLGPDGTMQLRQSNTFSTEEYEPEYDRYGGPAGVELAEWHFRSSSALVLAANRMLNLHLRSVALGFAAQLMMVAAACLLPDRDAMLTYFERYHDYWNSAATTPATMAILANAGPDGHDRGYEAVQPTLAPRFEQILSAVGSGDSAALPGTLRRWAVHCWELRDRIVELADAGALTFSPATSALPRLLTSYMHMTNNRLSMHLQDEAYLSYLLARLLRESKVGAQ